MAKMSAINKNNRRIELSNRFYKKKKSFKKNNNEQKFIFRRKI